MMLLTVVCVVVVLSVAVGGILFIAMAAGVLLASLFHCSCYRREQQCNKEYI